MGHRLPRSTSRLVSTRLVPPQRLRKHEPSAPLLDRLGRLGVHLQGLAGVAFGRRRIAHPQSRQSSTRPDLGQQRMLLGKRSGERRRGLVEMRERLVEAFELEESARDDVVKLAEQEGLTGGSIPQSQRALEVREALMALKARGPEPRAPGR